MSVPPGGTFGELVAHRLREEGCAEDYAVPRAIEIRRIRGH